MRKQQCWMANGGEVARVKGTDSRENASAGAERSMRGSTNSNSQGTNA